MPLLQVIYPAKFLLLSLTFVGTAERAQQVPPALLSLTLLTPHPSSSFDAGPKASYTSS